MVLSVDRGDREDWTHMDFKCGERITFPTTSTYESSEPVNMVRTLGKREASTHHGTPCPGVRVGVESP
jgi:hypothetical protein